MVFELMGNAAITAAKSVNYHGASTVEFLLDLHEHERFYFMEMNIRIQVEHPVTEMITGIDLIKEQISVAGGYPLSFQQSDVQINGWRWNAELMQKTRLKLTVIRGKCSCHDQRDVS
ncbi:acetyl/propionyl-CoA carboxylase alpha subunit [Neobacillus niacini]|nr:acetyl/propionyl-CoA carboxylase alpha subunit [Neobacillus niacini]